MLTIGQVAATDSQTRFEARESDRLLAWASFAPEGETVRVTGAGGVDSDALVGAVRAGLAAFWGRGLRRYVLAAALPPTGLAPEGSLAALFAHPCAAPRG